MKTTLLSLILISSLAAHAGGGAEGGGNTVVALSTAAQVSAAIDQARLAFRNETYMGALSYSARETSLWPALPSIVRTTMPPRLVEIIDELDGRAKSDYGRAALVIANVIDATRIDKRAAGPCQTSDGRHVEASVDMRDPNSPICFSLEFLRRVPSGLLKTQIQGLFAHEMMHKLGYGEDDAHLMQMYILAEIATGRSETRMGMAIELATARTSARDLLGKIASQGADATCMDLRNLSGNYLKLSQKAQDAYTSGLLDKDDVRKFGQPLNDFGKAFAAGKSISAPVPGQGLREHGLHIDEAFCMGRVTKTEIAARLEKIDRFAGESLAMIPLLLPSALTMDGGAQ